MSRLLTTCGCMLILVGVLASAAHAGDDLPRLYWSDSHKVYRSRLNGFQAEAVLEHRLGAPYGVAVDERTGQVYWSNGRHVRRSEGDGTDVRLILIDDVGIAGVAVDADRGKLYWIRSREQVAIMRCNLDGTAHETVLEIDGYGVDVAVDPIGRKVYWMTYKNAEGLIHRANLDGTKVELVTYAIIAPIDFALDPVARRLYWTSETDTGGRFMFSINFDGSDYVIMPAGGYSIAVDPTAGKIYYAGWTSLWRSDLDGTNSEQVADVDFEARHIALDTVNGYAYLSLSRAREMRRVRLEDGHQDFVFTDHFARPESLAFDPCRETLYFTDAIGTINRCRPDGSDIERVVKTSQRFDDIPQNIVVDSPGNALYWLQRSPVTFRTSLVMTATLDGDDTQTLFEVPKIIDFAVDSADHTLYWLSRDYLDPAVIQRAGLIGLSITDILTPEVSPNEFELDADGGWMYWSDVRDGIWRGRPDGTGVDNVVPFGDEENPPVALTLDVEGGHVYWSTQDPARIWRSDLDGSAVRQVFSPTSAPRWLTVYRPSGAECCGDADCDDGAWCNGAEACVAGACVSGAAACESPCDETADSCVDCLDDDDCVDGLFCNGVEVCVDGRCQFGARRCAGQSCNEATDACVDCFVTADCDDGLFCNGVETCDGVACVDGAVPCPGGTCDEDLDACFDRVAGQAQPGVEACGAGSLAAAMLCVMLLVGPRRRRVR